MTSVKYSSIRVSRINLICLLSLAVLPACSEQLKNETANYDAPPGWYKLEGTHKEIMMLEGEQEKVLTDKTIDEYFCMTAEEAKRKSKDQIVDSLEGIGFEIFEVKVTPLKDSIRAALPPQKNVQNSDSLTTVEYSPDYKRITTTLEGSLDHVDGRGSVMTRTTMTWLSADCANPEAD